jgi:hypothetical protein
VPGGAGFPGDDLANQVVIRRDTFGVPHILAETEEAAAFVRDMPPRNIACSLWHGCTCRPEERKPRTSGIYRKAPCRAD